MGYKNWLEHLTDVVGQVEDWEARWPEFRRSSSADDTSRAAAALAALGDRLGDNQPYFHPTYAGHMLKPPHPVAWAAYAATALINPNNQTREVGAATTDMELEVVEAIARMLGFDSRALGHLTSSGTIANLEAMWMAKELHPDRAVACTPAAHYNYARIARMLGIELVLLDSRPDETIDPARLARRLGGAEIGTVVATAGTTGLGVVDPIEAVIDLCEAHGVRVHVDGAYGGFFALLARRSPPLVDPAPFEAIGRADSVTIDPHKHGLQPYGCGCIVFRDATEAMPIYQHASPYTYLDADQRHLGQIQFECSRAGASAAALWTTLQVLELEAHRGLGDVLAAGRRAAVAWYEALKKSAWLRPVARPQTDILGYAPWPVDRDTVRASEVTAWTDATLEAVGDDAQLPVYLTRYDLPIAHARALWPGLIGDAQRVSVLRSCLMKPEHETWWPRLHERIEAHAEAAVSAQPPVRARPSAVLRRR